MSQRFTEEFKIQALKQIVEHGYSVASVAERLGVISSSLYNWIKVYLHLLSRGQFETNDIFFRFGLKLPNVDF